MSSEDPNKNNYLSKKPHLKHKKFHSNLYDAAKLIDEHNSSVQNEDDDLLTTLTTSSAKRKRRASSKKHRKSSKKSRRPRAMNQFGASTATSPVALDDEALIDRLLSRESEIIVPVPLPPWESSSPTPILITSAQPLTSAEGSINDITVDSARVVECNNDTLNKDFGIACLKKGLDLVPPVDDESAVADRSRHFSVKPMIPEEKKKENPNFKTPAQTARQIYVKNGYRDPQKRFPPKAIQPQQPNSLSFQARNPFLVPPPPQNLDPQMEEDLELLHSLKSSLGVLNAQALNVKQRTQMLYREAKRRRLSFFDGLLHRTHNLISEKQFETKRAMEDIDDTINRIKRHQRRMANSNFKLRRNQRFSDPDRYPNGMKKPLPKLPELNQKQIDQLMLFGLNHAKQMMNTVRQLNEALDEFEEQFNFPRFEPNSIDDFLKDTEL